MRCKTTPFGTFNKYSGELGGAFADLGTFLPLVLALIALNQFSPQGIFTGFGLFALFTAFYYRRPMPVQPMKVITALVIAQGLTPGMLQASGIMMGIILLVLAYSGAITWMAKQLSPAISIGIQLAIGLQLIGMGGQMIGHSPLIGLLALSALLLSRYLPLPYLAMPLVLTLGMLWQFNSDVAPSFALSAGSNWELGWPALDEWGAAAGLLVLPQLALTLTNAVIATSAMANEKFPEDHKKFNDRFSPKRFATSAGWANLFLAPIGAAAMCHGAGGLAVQHHFGARTWLTPTIFGAACLFIAAFWGQGIASLLSLIPLAVLGSLLAIAGMQLAWSKRFIDGKPFCIVVILSTAAICLLVNTAAGLAVGVILEMGRRQWRIIADLTR
ncbi:sulfate transporter [Shewanella colwelliana]|uniref:Sulfate transporter n=1 Tax=Shewanella colwelliana TaxID=23 RepID=A0A1E5IRJ3_SHECO|nr:putative sulfate/molybdate transporter [Shewanella colwelliana]OEG73176.1 sulfate transporter [Shewanella colwelliana]GIU38505.1 sulfate transporter [Shewanella colwelliana]